MPKRRPIILDLCGGTGAWSRPYKEADYNVHLITLPDHDVRTHRPPDNVYGILAAPPCTMFSIARTNAKKPRDLEQGMSLVVACLKIIWTCQYRVKTSTQKFSPLRFWALESPNSMLRWFLGKPAFEFDPYEFGNAYRKRTALWGCFNGPKKGPILDPSTLGKFDHLKIEEIHHGEHYGKLTRTEHRAITPAGFAKAFFKANR